MIHGFDPLELPLDRFCNWVWRMLTKDADEKTRNRIEMDMNRPLPGETPTVGVWSDDGMGASFMSLAGEMGLKV